MKTITRKVPQSALRAAVGRCEFLAPKEDDAGTVETQTNRGSIKLTASSGVPFNHPWWGRLVFDFSGMAHGERLTLDWCHDPDEIVGYADQISIDSGQLVIAGDLVSSGEDKAAELLVKGPAGVPYEASIKFDPWNGLTIEEIQEGMSSTVNGQQLAGPLVIVRTCLLRGVAVCPYGADPYTRTEFSQADAGEVDVAILTTEAEMSVETTDPAVTVVTAESLRTELAARVTDYANRFGAELGNRWCAADKPLLECYTEFVASLQTNNAAVIADLQAKLDAQTAAVTELESRIASLALGEKQPLSTTPAESKPESARVTELGVHLKPGLARFAAGLKLPAAAKP